MENKKNIALITTWFPPQHSVATNRMLAFAEFLSEDFNVTVFALDTKTYTKAWKQGVKVCYVQSNSWIDKLKSNTSDSKIKHKFKTGLRIVCATFFRKPLTKWQNKCVVEIINQCEIKPFDVIISSYAPQEAHLVALAIAKKYPTIKWIADMRDEMSKNPGVHAQLAKQYRETEKDIGRFATALTTVSQPILNDFKELCPTIPFYEEIRNGYNHDFKPLPYAKNEKFTLGYFGTFYGIIKPTIFLDALCLVLKRRKDFDFQLKLVGTPYNFDIPAEIKSKISFQNSVPYLDAIQGMMKTDFNVLINPQSSRKGVFTGKLFDYVSSGRPIIAFVDKDDVASHLIQEFKAGYVAEFSNLEENALIIEQAFDDWLNNTITQVSEENRLSLHRKNQVDKLAQLIKKIIAS